MASSEDAFGDAQAAGDVVSGVVTALVAACGRALYEAYVSPKLAPYALARAEHVSPRRAVMSALSCPAACARLARGRRAC